MARKKTKTVMMLVEVKCPHWLTAARARREVRTLINEQCFYGHQAGFHDPLVEIDESNFRAVKVTPVR